MSNESKSILATGAAGTHSTDTAPEQPIEHKRSCFAYDSLSPIGHCTCGADLANLARQNKARSVQPSPATGGELTVPMLADACASWLDDFKATRHRMPGYSEAFDAGAKWRAGRVAGGELDVEAERLLEESIDTHDFYEMICSYKRGGEGSTLWSDIIDHIYEYTKREVAATRRAATGTPAKRAPGEWISVEDRLPEPGQRVIAYRPTAEQSEDQPIRVIQYTGRMRESWQGVEHGFDCICHPTHWQPLPAAPSNSPVGAKEQDK